MSREQTEVLHVFGRLINDEFPATGLPAVDGIDRAQRFRDVPRFRAVQLAPQRGELNLEPLKSLMVCEVFEKPFLIERSAGEVPLGSPAGFCGKVGLGGDRYLGMTPE